MEDTQMSSADVPQAPQPDANPAPAPQAEAPQTPAPKKGGVIMKALIGVFAVAIIGFGGWYAYNSGISGAAEDTPPSLSLGAAGFQGKSVETTFGFLQLDDADVSAHVDRLGSVYMTSETGVRWFYPKANTTFGEIESAFKPIAGMKILMAFYDAEEPWPGDSDGIKKGCFVTYPIGPYQHTCLGDLTTPIDKNRGLAVITNIPSVDNVTPVFEYDSTLLGDAKTLSDGLTLPDLKGWTLHPFAAGMDLTDSKIRSVWIQTNAAEIKTQVTDVSSVDTSSEYKMMWLKLGDPVDAGTTTDGGGTPPGICGDGTVDAGEACDDGNTIDGDGCSATCTTEAVCGDGNVDSGEECDGGPGCGADCKFTEVCGNDTIDGTDVCDGTDLGGKNCTNYITNSAFTGGTLGCAADCSAYDTSACVASSVGTDPSTYYTDTGTYADTYVGSNVGALIGGGAPIGGGTSSPYGDLVGTSPDDAYIEKVEYIDNIENEFPNATIDPNIHGTLYAPWTFTGIDASTGDYICFASICKDDILHNYLPVTAIKVTAGGTTGNVKLTQVNFTSTGEAEGASGTLFNYCEGADVWQFYRIREDASGGTWDSVVFKIPTSLVDARGNHRFEDESAFSYDSTAATINAGETAIFFLLMKDMSHCHDESEPEGSSWSQTDITRLEFIEGDLSEKVFLKTDIDYHDLARKIFWT